MALSFLIWCPIVSGLLLFLFPGASSSRTCQNFSLGSALFTLIWSVGLLTQIDLHHSGWQLQEYVPWVQSIGLNYALAIDVISLPLVWLNCLLVMIAIFASRGVKRPRFYFGLLLLLSGGVLGAFLSTNLLLFFLFFELELIPLYLLIAVWGGERRGYAATKFLLYTALSGILMLLAFFACATQFPISFDWQVLHDRALAEPLQLVCLGLLLLSFGIKIPLVPLHTWLPDAHVEASTPISVLLAGILLKLGTYGLLRFGLALFPDAWAVFAPYLAWWAVLSVLYGCFTAITQTDMKKMVAYSSIGHMGYVLLALAAHTPLSVVGAMWQMVSHGIISALLFLLVGTISSKAGTRDLNKLQGLFNPECGLPLTGTLMVLAAMASGGIPGLMGFVAEFLVFRGSFTVFPSATLLCMVGTGLTAVYFLILLDKAFFGRIVEPLPPVSWQDKLPAFVLALVIIGLGLQPSWLSQVWTSADLPLPF